MACCVGCRAAYGRGRPTARTTQRRRDGTIRARPPGMGASACPCPWHFGRQSFHGLPCHAGTASKSVVCVGACAVLLFLQLAGTAAALVGATHAAMRGAHRNTGARAGCTPSPAAMHMHPAQDQRRLDAWVAEKASGARAQVRSGGPLVPPSPPPPPPDPIARSLRYLEQACRFTCRRHMHRGQALHASTHVSAGGRHKRRRRRRQQWHVYSIRDGGGDGGPGQHMQCSPAIERLLD